MGPSYPENVTSLQAQTFTSGEASLFVYIGFWACFEGHDLCVAVDQLKNQAFQCRWFYSYSPRQRNKP